MGLATLLSKKKYTNEDREAGKAALAMGMIGISEGAIPFAAKDPLRVIFSICVGSAVGSIIAMIAKAECYAPHGGPIVALVVENKLWYIISIIVGALVTALLVNFLKRDLTEEEIEGLE
ncbi:PTS system mannose-specific EIIBCA component [compost metagenome]